MLTNEERVALSKFWAAVAIEERGDDPTVSPESALENYVQVRVAAALEAAAVEIDRIATEHRTEDAASECRSQFCSGWLLGQDHAARIVRAAAHSPPT